MGSGLPARDELQRRSLQRADEPRSLRLSDLILPLGIAAIVRLMVVLAFLGTLGQGDEAAYLRLGWGWAEFDTYTGMWAPLFPRLISFLYMAFGEGAGDALRVLQIGMAVWTGAWMAFTADMFGGRKAGLLAAWMFALYLPLAGFSALVYSESLFLSFFTPALYQLLRYAREGRIAAPAWRGPLAGLLLGLSALTRESTLLFIGPCVIWVAFAVRGRVSEKQAGQTRFQVWTHGKGPLAIAPALLIGLTALLVILPWTVRNGHLFNRLVPIATSFHGSSTVGWNALDINYDIADLGEDVLDAPGELRDAILGPAPAPWRPRPVINRGDAARTNIRDGMQFARANPVFFARSRVVEFIDLVSPQSFILRSFRLTEGLSEPLHSPAIRGIFSILAVLMMPVTVLLGLWGWAHARDAGPLRSLVATLVVCTLGVAFVSGMTRYRVPAMPMVIVLGAIYLSGHLETPPRARRILHSALVVGIILAWVPSFGPTTDAITRIWNP